MSGGQQREVAHRLLADEYDDATVSIAESDAEMAPTYVLTPAGAMVNRLFVVGALTDVDQVGDEVYRARLSDPTGTFVCYAGQYQPDAANFFADVSPPAFVAMTAKARTFQPENSDEVLSSLRPERIVTADAGARQRWVTEAVVQTLARIEAFAAARVSDGPIAEIADRLEARGVRPNIALGIQRACEEYDTSATYLKARRDRAIAALEVLAGDREEVDPVELDPDAAGSATFAELATEHFVDRLRSADASASLVDAPAEDSQPTEESTSAAAEPETVEADTDGSPPEAAPEPTAGEGLEPPDEAYELTEEEREEIETSFGTDFATGDEVETADEPSSPPETEEAPADASGSSSTDDATEADDEDSELQPIVLEQMRDLDDGDGAERSALVDAVVAETDADPETVEDAIQEALMSGTCYEPQEDRLKPI